MKLGSFQVALARDSPREKKVFADLSPEERENCRKFWLKFRILERLHWGVLPLPALLWWLFAVLAAKAPRGIGYVVLTVFILSGVWLYNLECPRCHAKFSGGLIALLPQVRYPWDCYGRDLSRRELRYISQHVT